MEKEVNSSEKVVEVRKRATGININPGQVDSLEMKNLIFPLSTSNSDYEAIENLYIKNMLLQKIVNILVEDAFRRTVHADSGDEKLDKNINHVFLELGCKKKAVEALKEMLKQGDAGVIALIEEFGGTNDLTADLPKRFKELIDFNVYGRAEIVSLRKQNDLSKRAYREVDRIRVYLTPSTYTEVDNTRFHHMQFNSKKKKIKTLGFSNTEFGNSIFVSLQDPINSFRKIYEGISMAAFRGSLVVYKCDDKTLKEIKGMNATEQKQFNDRFSKKNIHIIGNDDEIVVINGASGFQAKEFQEIAEQYISNLLDIPDSRWLGSQTGAVSSSGSDIKRYDDKIENFMEVYGLPLLRFMYKTIYHSFNKDGAKFEIVLGDLHKLSAEEEAKVNELNSKAFKNYADAMQKISSKAKEAIRGILEDKFDGTWFEKVLGRFKK